MIFCPLFTDLRTNPGTIGIDLGIYLAKRYKFMLLRYTGCPWIVFTKRKTSGKTFYYLLIFEKNAFFKKIASKMGNFVHNNKNNNLYLAYCWYKQYKTKEIRNEISYYMSQK